MELLNLFFILRSIPASTVLSQMKKYDEKSRRYEYTDDTAMARQVADSLVHCNKVDAKDMATR